MIFQKPRKLPYGKEIFRTKNFTLIYLGAGNLHYSYLSDKGLTYGHVNLKKLPIKILPVIAIIGLTALYLFLSYPTSAMIEPKNPKLVSGMPETEEEKDNKAKHADDEYLKKTEEQKQAILKSPSSDSSTGIKLKTYYVREGESLEEIAARFRTTPKIIAMHSKIKKSAVLVEGQKLIVPEKQGILYKLKSGDSLAKVASTYKVSIDDVMTENSLDNPDLLPMGRKLFLPGAVLPDPPPIWFKPVSSGIITSGFGWRTFPRYQFHEAWDLKAQYEPVKAARSGKVIFSGWMGGYGNVVIIEHTSELKTLYAHNSKLFVREGEYILGGKVISRSGCTGYCFGAHLHFEVIKNGASVNPKTYIKGFYTAK
ncbi:MAG: peptidoglycan DD-metalloendopeptidase family protein [Leptospiraceae bacterium]|nr:peptidoglycan DD-metalloendopeptidase family protein [Leptospiraceae bacterium]